MTEKRRSAPRDGRRARWWARRAVAGAVLALALLLVFGWLLPEPAVRRHVVEIEGFAFRPAELRVAAGDTVVWINRDIVPHTATDSAGHWDSGELEKGASWSFVPRASGELSYLCALHSSMTGRIVVR